MTIAPRSTKKMSLPVALFSDAMERQLSLASYATTIDLHPDILRQALTGRLQDADPDPLNGLTKALNRDPEQLDLTTPPCDESFGLWLKRNMEGITQHGLRARAQLDSQTLKRFLNGDLLPDSDQAERISRALYIGRMEIARVVTANMAAACASIARQATAEPSALERQSKQSIDVDPLTAASRLRKNGQRRRASSPHPSAQPVGLQKAVAPATIDETASATAESGIAATGTSPIAGKRLKRTHSSQAQRATPAIAALTTHRPPDEIAALPVAEAQEAEQDGASAPAAADPLTEQGQPPTAQQAQLKPSRSRRKPNQTSTSSPSALVDGSTSSQSRRQPIAEAYPASQPAASVEHVAVDAPPTPAPTVTGKAAGTRRAKRSTANGVVAVAAAEQMPAPTQTVENRPEAEFVDEDKSISQANASQRPRNMKRPATDISSGGEVPSALVAEMAPPKPDERRAASSRDQTAPLVAAELAAATTSLQLSADEVRLIRHWRQLHPHGRRATLQYIGSLLVDD